VQKRKNIDAIAMGAKLRGIEPVLEISSKSTVDLGRALSAFSLKHQTSNGSMIPLESAFQSAKVFQGGGPFIDLQDKKPKDARRDSRLKFSGKLLHFELDGHQWSLELGTAFYDWIYCRAMFQLEAIVKPIFSYAGFSDIEFNPNKSLNCQARSCALYSALHSDGVLKDAMANKDLFKSFYGNVENQHSDLTLFDNL